MSLTYGVYKLICDGEQVGYRLVTELGVFDCGLAASSRITSKSDILGSIPVINKDGRYYSNEELSGNAYSEISRTNLQLDILLNSLGIAELDVDLIFGKSKLFKYIEPVAHLNKRFCFDTIKEFLDSKIGSTRNILALFGLRRTGKTVMIQQAVKHLTGNGVSSEKIACLTLKDNKIDEIKLRDYISVLYDVFDIDYLFIDELTYAVGGLSFLSSLSDFYTTKKTILSGTNSLGFVPLLRHTLFYRAIRVNTTYISYKEFSDLYPSAKLLDYIKAGGILGVDKNYLKSHANIDSYIDASNEYLISSVVRNLFSGLENFDDLSFDYRLLSDMYFEDSERLKALVNNWLQHYGSDLVLKIVRGVPLGSSEVSTTIVNLRSSVADWSSFKDELRTLYLKRLKLIDDTYNFTNDELSDVKDFLSKIECYKKCDMTFYKGSDEEKVSSRQLVFLIPVILRYSLLSLIMSIVDDNYSELAVKYNVTIDIVEFKKRLLTTAIGQLFEDVIYLEFMQHGIDFGFYRDSNKEVDLVYKAIEGYHLYEIKLTNKIYLSDLKWLLCRDVIDKFQPVELCVLSNIPEDKEIHCTEYDVIKAVADKYTSRKPPAWVSERLKTADKDTVYTVHYRNASEFLKSMEDVSTEYDFNLLSESDDCDE